MSDDNGQIERNRHAEIAVAGAIGNLVPEIGGTHLPPSLQILLNDGLYERVKQLSGVMARANGFTPGHLIGKSEACFAIINMSLDWKLNPHFVARHTYQTPGGQIGYDGALVQSILEQSGRFIGAPLLDYRGDWQRLTGKFKIMEGSRGGKFPVPTWNAADAVGLGVIVRWQVRGEREPRVWPGEDNPFWLTQCFPLNSPLWATDPKTQIAYLAIRRFANLTSPGILGAASFDQDELLDASERAVDVTPRRGDLDGLDVGNIAPQRAQHPNPAMPREAPQPEFEVVDLDGVVRAFENPAHAEAALRIILQEAARQGLDRLDGAWESNLATAEQLDAHEAHLLHEYSDLRTALLVAAAEAARKREEEAAAAEHQRQQDEAAAAERQRQEEAAAAAARAAANPAPAPASAAQPAGALIGEAEPVGAEPVATEQPPNATAGQLSAGGEGRIGGSILPTEAASPQPAEENRPSRAINTVLRRSGPDSGKPDWLTWTRALFMPKLRQQKTDADLAWFLGDNEAHLEQGKAALASADRADLEQAIAEQWKKIGLGDSTNR